MVENSSSPNKLALLGGPPTTTLEFRPKNPFGPEEILAARNALESGLLSGFLGTHSPEFHGGPKVREFESRWSEKFEIPHAVSVNSATSGLVAAVGAAGIGPGDEVIVPPYTMSATVVAPLAYGAIPIFADIERETFSIDPQAVLGKITSRTKAIIAVNLFGHPAHLAELRVIADSHGLILIEDNAQSILAKESNRYSGTVGHIGVFSLNVHKHINTGEGGMCVTSDPNLAWRLELIRNHGENVVGNLDASDLANTFGFNLRMTELTAAVGIEQLRKLDADVQTRIAVAEDWIDRLGGLQGLTSPTIRVGCEHSFLTWALRYDEQMTGVPRSLFSKALKAEGIPHSVGYVKPLYYLPMFQNLIAIGQHGFPFNLGSPDYSAGICPNAELMHENELLLLDIYTYDSDSGFANAVPEAIVKIHSQLGSLASRI